jgi:hypothetical protein
MANKDRKQTNADLLVGEPCGNFSRHFLQSWAFGTDG